MKLKRKLVVKIIAGTFCASALLYYIWMFPISSNLHEVVKDKIYRSGQPRLEQLRSWINRYNIKTVINLRGANAPHAAEEVQLAKELNVRIVFFELSAYKLMSAEKLIELLDVLKEAQQPVLIHCKNGVDRAGAVSALAAWLVGGKDFETAERQLYVPPGPWKRRWFISPHISDTLEMYESYCYRNKLDLDSIEQFDKWIKTVYNDYLCSVKK
jgi:protein tyrosine/serine phosphatase